jgi:hypothetical protein
MIRTLMTVGLLSVVSSCAWRGDTKFVATYTSLPPVGTNLGTQRWAVDLDAKQITFDTEQPRSLTDAQVSSLKSSLSALAPASKESCKEDGEVRVIELSDEQTRYAEQTHACSGDAQGAYLYVESLEKVFTQLRDIVH